MGSDSSSLFNIDICVTFLFLFSVALVPRGSFRDCFILYCTKGGNGVGKIVPSMSHDLSMSRNIGSPFFLLLLGIYWYVFFLDEDSAISFFTTFDSGTIKDFGLCTL